MGYNAFKNIDNETDFYVFRADPSELGGRWAGKSKIEKAVQTIVEKYYAHLSVSQKANKSKGLVQLWVVEGGRKSDPRVAVVEINTKNKTSQIIKIDNKSKILKTFGKSPAQIEFKNEFDDLMCGISKDIKWGKNTLEAVDNKQEYSSFSQQVPALISFRGDEYQKEPQAIPEPAWANPVTCHYIDSDLPGTQFSDRSFVYQSQEYHMKDCFQAVFPNAHYNSRGNLYKFREKYKRLGNKSLPAKERRLANESLYREPRHELFFNKDKNGKKYVTWVEFTNNNQGVKDSKHGYRIRYKGEINNFPSDKIRPCLRQMHDALELSLNKASVSLSTEKRHINQLQEQVKKELLIWINESGYGKSPWQDSDKLYKELRDKEDACDRVRGYIDLFRKPYNRAEAAAVEQYRNEHEQKDDDENNYYLEHQHLALFKEHIQKIPKEDISKDLEYVAGIAGASTTNTYCRNIITWYERFAHSGDQGDDDQFRYPTDPDEVELALRAMREIELRPGREIVFYTVNGVPDYYFVNKLHYKSNAQLNEFKIEEDKEEEENNIVDVLQYEQKDDDNNGIADDAGGDDVAAIVNDEDDGQLEEEEKKIDDDLGVAVNHRQDGGDDRPAHPMYPVLKVKQKKVVDDGGSIQYPKLLSQAQANAKIRRQRDFLYKRPVIYSSPILDDQDVQDMSDLVSEGDQDELLLSSVNQNSVSDVVNNHSNGSSAANPSQDEPLVAQKVVSDGRHRIDHIEDHGNEVKRVVQELIKEQERDAQQLNSNQAQAGNGVNGDQQNADAAAPLLPIDKGAVAQVSQCHQVDEPGVTERRIPFAVKDQTTKITLKLRHQADGGCEILASVEKLQDGSWRSVEASDALKQLSAQESKRLASTAMRIFLVGAYGKQPRPESVQAIDIPTENDAIPELSRALVDEKAKQVASVVKQAGYQSSPSAWFNSKNPQNARKYPNSEFKTMQEEGPVKLVDDEEPGVDHAAAAKAQ